jgi:hypothetical protein
MYIPSRTNINVGKMVIPPFKGTSPNNPSSLANKFPTNPASTGTSDLDPLQETLPQQFYGNQLANIPQTGSNPGNSTHLKPLLLATPHFLETKVQLPAYNPEPFGRKPIKIKSGAKGLVFNGTNMDISDFIKRLEYAAQLDGAQGSDISLQIIFFLEGEPLIKEVQ